MAGTLESIHVSDAEGAPMRPLMQARVGAKGIEGDRYAAERGHFSGKPASGRALTLIEAEVIDELRLAPGESRRNLVTRGISLNALVGRRFRVGGVLCEGMRLCEPCAYLEGLTGKALLRPMAGRGGLRADVLESGEIRTGDSVEALPLVRPIAAGDLHAIVALNNAFSSELGFVDAAKMQHFLSLAALAAAIGPEGDPDAFLVAFDERIPAQGPNHAWFLAHLPRFLYVDRVCVHARARRRGLARALYDHAGAASPLLCCEVNFEPPNPGSDAFHAALGFREVGRAYLPDRNKSVRYLQRP